MRFAFLNAPYLITGTTLLITYASVNCLKRNRNMTVPKGGSQTRPKKAIVERSIRLSFRNDLPKSEGSDEDTFRVTPKTFTNIDKTQTGKPTVPTALLIPSREQQQVNEQAIKYLKSCRTQMATRKSVKDGILREEPTQPSPSMDRTQTSNTEDDTSHTLTESSVESHRKRSNGTKNMVPERTQLVAPHDHSTVVVSMSNKPMHSARRPEADESKSVDETNAGTNGAATARGNNGMYSSGTETHSSKSPGAR